MKHPRPNVLLSAIAVVCVACTGEIAGPPTTSTAKSSHAKLSSPPPTEGATPSSDVPFDPGKAARVLGSINVATCRAPNGPSGAGHVTVTFENDGTVSKSVVDAGPFPGTAVGGCIAALFRTAAVPPFAGAPVHVGKSFTLEPA
jgi:hypothetical protein